MVSTPITSIFDAAKWFLRVGEEEGVYIPPLKLNFLLYLSQAYYAAAKSGMKLMPAFFVANDLGPLDPNLYRALEQKNLNIYFEEITGEALLLLKGIWKKYGKKSANDLSVMLKSHTPYKKAYLSKIKNNEIPLSLMAAFYGAEKAEKKEVKTAKPFAKNQFGSVVKVSKWKIAKKTEK